VCGIGIIWGGRDGHALEQVGVLLDAMAHRGPSGRGTFSYVGGAAGMVRLALVDLTEKGQQPIWSPDHKVAILFNGEVYNFREERARLEKNGYPFVSTTDSEVVLALYLEQGVAFLERLRGMYAIALFDWREGGRSAAPKLLLARDPFGIKPLYVAGSERGDRGLTVASELKALLFSGRASREIDREGLAQYLAHGFLVQPRTILSSVRMLEAGTYEIYEPGRPMVRCRFWRVPPARPREETLADAARRLRAELEESVALHAFADAPVGVFLSGGVDSTAIAALMRKHTAKLRSYTLSLPGSSGGDEAEEATTMAARLGCENTVVEARGEEMPSLLPRFARDLDQPSADGLNTWLISRAAARDVRGVLSGLGGDEWFAGYPSSRRMSWLRGTRQGRLTELAGKLSSLVASRLEPEKAPPRLMSIAARRSPLALWVLAHTNFTEAMAKRMAGGLPDPRSGLTRFEALLDGPFPGWRGESAVGLGCLLDVEVYMGCQLLRDSDATSMAHSLELRVPFVDLRIAEFSRSCKDEYKLSPAGGADLQYQNSGAKRVVIEALRELLPPELEKRKKRGFTLPLEYWMRTSLRDMIDDACALSSIKRRGLLDPKAVARALDPHAGANLYPQRWSMFILELWLQEVLDRAAIPARPSEQATPELRKAVSC
jgi:asparagine synthase (glutamine-hydrolysing)